MHSAEVSQVDKMVWYLPGMGQSGRILCGLYFTQKSRVEYPQIRNINGNALEKRVKRSIMYKLYRWIGERYFRD